MQGAAQNGLTCGRPPGGGEFRGPGFLALLPVASRARVVVVV